MTRTASCSASWGWMLDGLADANRERAPDALMATVTAPAGTDRITFASAAWLIRAARPAGQAR